MPRKLPPPPDAPPWPSTAAEIFKGLECHRGDKLERTMAWVDALLKAHAKLTKDYGILNQAYEDYKRTLSKVRQSRVQDASDQRVAEIVLRQLTLMLSGLKRLTHLDHTPSRPQPAVKFQHRAAAWRLDVFPVSG